MSEGSEYPEKDNFKYLPVPLFGKKQYEVTYEVGSTSPCSTFQVSAEGTRIGFRSTRELITHDDKVIYLQFNFHLLDAAEGTGQYSITLFDYTSGEEEAKCVDLADDMHCEHIPNTQQPANMISPMHNGDFNHIVVEVEDDQATITINGADVLYCIHPMFREAVATFVVNVKSDEDCQPDVVVIEVGLPGIAYGLIGISTAMMLLGLMGVVNAKSTEKKDKDKKKD